MGLLSRQRVAVAPAKGGWVNRIRTPPEPHVCHKPMDKEPRRVGRFEFDQPPQDADVGSTWRCSCGGLWEIYAAPHAIGSGSVWHENEWRRVEVRTCECGIADHFCPSPGHATECAGLGGSETTGADNDGSPSERGE